MCGVACHYIATPMFPFHRERAKLDNRINFKA